MTVLVVIGCILLFIFLILLLSPTLYVKIADEVSISAGICGIRINIFPQDKKEEDESKEEQKKEKKQKKKIKKEIKKIDKKPNEKSFSDIVDMIFMLAKSILGPLKKMLKHVRFNKLYINVLVGAESADETAISYGKMCSMIFPVVGMIDSIATLKIKSVNVSPNFLLSEIRYDISFKVKLRLLWIVKVAFGIIFNIIVNTMKKSKSEAVS